VYLIQGIPHLNVPEEIVSSNNAKSWYYPYFGKQSQTRILPENSEFGPIEARDVIYGPFQASNSLVPSVGQIYLTNTYGHLASIIYDLHILAGNPRSQRC
jgi:hypothetical protein